MERTPRADAALDAERAAVRLHDPLRNRQTEPGAVPPRLFLTPAALEDEEELLAWDSGALVLDRKPCPIAAKLRAQPNGTMVDQNDVPRPAFCGLTKQAVGACPGENAATQCK